MLCQTIKAGKECFFMGKQGCSYNGGICYPVVESCQGCGKTVIARRLLPILPRTTNQMEKRLL
jgi:hypothetical protein